jgi:hypothetical protein
VGLKEDLEYAAVHMSMPVYISIFIAENVTLSKKNLRDAILQCGALAVTPLP